MKQCKVRRGIIEKGSLDKEKTKTGVGGAKKAQDRRLKKCGTGREARQSTLRQPPALGISEAGLGRWYLP